MRARVCQMRGRYKPRIVRKGLFHTGTSHYESRNAGEQGFARCGVDISHASFDNKKNGENCIETISVLVSLTKRSTRIPISRLWPAIPVGTEPYMHICCPRVIFKRNFAFSLSLSLSLPVHDLSLLIQLQETMDIFHFFSFSFLFFFQTISSPIYLFLFCYFTY